MIFDLPLISLSKHIADQADSWKKAALSNDDYFKQYFEYLKKIKIGCSFAPEEFNNQESALVGLEIVIRDLNIRDIRLGIRWKNAIDNASNIDISYYEKYIDYCIKNAVNICLNVGPVKTFRWPEDHVPENILKKIRFKTKNNSLIKPYSHLSDEAFDYLNKLLACFIKKYSKKELEKIKIIQPENEAFNRFGENRWIMSNEYLIKLTDIIKRYFPDVKILLNSGGCQELNIISGFFKILLIRDGSFKEKLISGFDYYYLFPPFSNIPFVGRLDPITISKIFGGNACAKNIKNSREIGFDIEVTELQMEPWGKFLSPGASARELRFALLRVINQVLGTQKGSVVRVWGVELLAKRIMENNINKEHKEIIELIKIINSD